MSTSTAALTFAPRKPTRPSRRGISHNLVGGLTAACAVLGCGWTVYSNILAASVYPTLGSGGYEERVALLQPTRGTTPGTRSAPSFEEVFAAFAEQATPTIRPADVAPITPSMFNERFAASEPQSVPSNSGSATPPPDQPNFSEQRGDTRTVAAVKPANAPKAAEAQKQKQAQQAPSQLALNGPEQRPTADAAPAKSSGISLRDMAQRAKDAVMSITAGERRPIVEKLWGKQPSTPSLLAYASADASVTGSIGQNQNPALGGSPPYDRSTAVYDISAHMVYLPDGSKLEAHSGLGSNLDDPRSARMRMRGVTPPHIYELKPREALFHGVPALRLTPIGGEDAIYGRSGLLAHTYMLGPNGDSNGCVSFRDYSAFLNAYHNKGIRKLAVLARID
jgi:type VI secretion system (T6SS) effector TldE1-like protein